MIGFVCRGCKNHFLRDGLCTTCGAGKLYDATVESQGAEIERQRAEIESLCAEIERIEKDGWHGFVHEIEKLRAENERLRSMLPPTAHTGVRNGPGEGSWSAFAEKVVAERDAARAEVVRLRAALEYMVNVCPAIDPDGDRAHEQARKALEGKP